jgi:hypothetical protein
MNLKSRIKDKLRKQASIAAPLIANPLIYGALGAGAGGVAAGLKGMYMGAPFEAGFNEGVSPGLKAGLISGALMGAGPALARLYGKQAPALLAPSALTAIPAATPGLMAGWQSIPSF